MLHYADEVPVGYRGWRAEPLFPFGHGLGYTRWEYASLVVERDPAGPVAVVGLRNVGDRPGREVVQVYVGPTEPDSDRPERWLAGFATVGAAPGELVTVRIPIPPAATRTWRAGGWQNPATGYTVEAAHCLTDRRLATRVRLP